MASRRTTNNRRRSLSNSSVTSTSPLPRRTPENSWRAATKRAHHSCVSSYSTLTSARKCDVDAWRKSKKLRKDISLPHEDVALGLVSNASSVLNPAHRSCPSPSKPVFASTSAEFHLFPKQSQRKREPARHIDAISTVSSQIDRHALNDLTQLRSDAFGELQRSVTENGEGLVRRMRDFEDSRSRSEQDSNTGELHKRGRKPKSLLIRSWKGHASVNGPDQDEDVQIFAGESDDFPLSEGPRRERALSLGLMDLDPYHSDVHSSPSATSASFDSTYLSDEEPHHVDTAQLLEHAISPSSPYISPSALSFTPALSQTYSNSANSSLVSLPLPPPFSLPNANISSSEHDLLLMSISPFKSGVGLSLPSSRSEKAIAALALAMANGAGGLNDYESLRAIYGPLSLEDCDVGELWH